MQDSKRTICTFVLVELFVFLAQAAVIFLAAYFVSGMLLNEEKLTHVVMSKLNANSAEDFKWTLFALVAVFGVVALVRYFIENGTVRDISSAIIDEFPRTFYFFGANLAAMSLITGLYLQDHPSKENPSPIPFFLYSLFFGAFFFTSGCLLNYFLRRRAGLPLSSPRQATDAV